MYGEQLYPVLGRWALRWNHLYELVLNRVARCRAARGHAKFAIDRAHARVDCEQADDQLPGDLRAGQALRKQTEHVHFTRCKPGMKRRSKGSRCGREDV